MYTRFWIALMTLFFSLSLHAQLSPGKLAQAHAELEGLAQCASCHAMGSDDFSGKCLTCHKALAERIKQDKGLHASPAYKRCQTCHSDHHGLDYALIHWPKGREAFDHAKTGYKLEGGHLKLECKSCHQEKNQKTPLGKAQGANPQRSFLGLTRACLGCHEDTHRKQLGDDCLNCHVMESWKPARAFDHSRTDFPLQGAHAKQTCNACHPSETGGAGMRFKPIAHERCADCHKDVHRGSLSENCASCHSLDSFTPASRFNHKSTRFPLSGRHGDADCASCHPKLTDKAALLFTHKAQGPLQKCQSCHRDPHEQRLGPDCASCHATDGWQRVNNAQFDHNRTRFPLKDKHATVACGKCHGPGFKTKGFEDCANCHKDVHAGQFKTTAGSCGSCHDVRGFRPSLFTLQRHQASRFPLDGAHLATPCFACHQSVAPKETVSYHFASIDCLSCHSDIHHGQATPFMRGKGDCLACHQTSSWQKIRFDHAQTRFPLVGAHQQTACGKCHQSGPDRSPKLSGLSADCASCHKDIHQGQFADDKGVTRCETCHTPSRWPTIHFDHSRTRFPLDGAHQGVACAACHKPVPGAQNQQIRYKPLDRACASCHAATNPPR